MRTARRPQHVVRGVHVGHPVAKRLVDGVLQGPRAVPHRNDGGAETFHPEHVGTLPGDIDLPHVDRALQSEPGGHGRGGDPVLTRAGLGDDPRLAHPLHQQPLSHDVVGLVGAGVVQVLALDVDTDPTEALAQVLGQGERGCAAAIARHQPFVRLPERGVAPGTLERVLELIERRDQNLGDIGAAEPRVVASVTHGEWLRCPARTPPRRCGRRARQRRRPALAGSPASA